MQAEHFHCRFRFAWYCRSAGVCDLCLDLCFYIVVARQIICIRWMRMSVARWTSSRVFFLGSSLRMARFFGKSSCSTLEKVSVNCTLYSLNTWHSVTLAYDVLCTEKLWFWTTSYMFGFNHIVLFVSYMIWTACDNVKVRPSFLRVHVSKDVWGWVWTWIDAFTMSTLTGLYPRKSLLRGTVGDAFQREGGQINYYSRWGLESLCQSWDRKTHDTLACVCQRAEWHSQLYNTRLPVCLDVFSRV